MTKTATIFAATLAIVLYAITTLAPAYVAQVKHHQSVHAERLAQLEKFQEAVMNRRYNRIDPVTKGLVIYYAFTLVVVVSYVLIRFS